jgi:hypothetical protein
MLEKMVEKELLKKDNFEMLLIDNEIEALLEKMHNFKPKPVPKWMNKHQS